MITDNDLELFDIISYSYRSFALIKDLTDYLIHDAENKRLTFETLFYNAWSKKRGINQEIPLNPGTMLMISWAVIVNSKENWIDFIPETPIEKSDPKWGLKRIKILKRKGKQPPSIRDVVWKIRNSLSHSDFTVKPGKDGTPWSVFLNETFFTFKDSKGGKFELEINMIELSMLNVTIYETIRQKMLEYSASRGKNE